MTENDYIKSLLRKYLLEDLQADERAALEAWAAHHPANRELLDRYLSGRFVDDLMDFHQGAGLVEETYDYVMANSLAPTAKRKPLLLYKWLPYAAAVLLVAATASWFFLGNRTNPEPTVADIELEDIAPAGNRATLALADGRTIVLNEAQTGIVVGDGITYADGSAVLHLDGGESERSADGSQTELTTDNLQLTTPKGGTYHVTLSDGTQVWLNAGSTLRYPRQFGKTERVVELEGEGYFSVARAEDKPFKVISSGQRIEVLGTEFNLSAYGDEPLVKTTLVKGSVRVATIGNPTSLVLTPGEQSSVSSSGSLTKADVNFKKELAWRMGLFYFEETTFEELLRQVGRWYDVTIQYEGHVPQESFSGIMSRNVPLKTLLNYLRESAVEFTLEDQILFVKTKL